MIIQTQITEDEFNEFSNFAIYKAIKSYCWIPFVKGILVWVSAAVLLSAFFNDSASAHVINWFLLLAATIPLFIYVALNKVFEYLTMKKLRPLPDGVINCPKEFEFTAEGFTESFQLGSSQYKWEAVIGLEEHNESIYLFIDNLMAHIFPPSSFESTEQKKQFLKMINAHL